MYCDGTAGDTFDESDLTFLQKAAHRRMPNYRTAPRDNGAISWMVLEPDAFTALPSFTICRIDPCIVVRIEEAGTHRFVSVASLDDAVVVAEHAVCEANARRNIHLAPHMTQ